jgi:diguanylate cyclase (GGDEF)-like protein
VQRDQIAPVEDPEANSRAGDARDRNAEDRDQRAQAQDQVSETRDERGAARDRRAKIREETALLHHAEAASDRAAALRDRRGAANDRLQAADDREAAADDRVVSAKDRAISSIDDLTGAYRRDAGTLELERETSRATRTGGSMTLAFVDVDGLKVTNDSKGHAAGDRLLHRTVESMRAHLRSYDLIVRFGGDEFVCSFIDLTAVEAAKRFDAINADLAETGDGSITVGLAELQPDDSLAGLIARADDALYRDRNKRGTPPGGART